MGVFGTLALGLALILTIIVQACVFFEVAELRHTLRELIDREGDGRHANPEG